MQALKFAAGVALAVGMMVVALWTWRHAARLADSDVTWLAARSAAIALAAGAQVVIVAMISGAKDRLLRGFGFAAAGVCVVGIVSAVALALAGR